MRTHLPESKEICEELVSQHEAQTSAVDKIEDDGDYGRETSRAEYAQ